MEFFTKIKGICLPRCHQVYKFKTSLYDYWSPTIRWKLHLHAISTTYGLLLYGSLSVTILSSWCFGLNFSLRFFATGSVPYSNFTETRAPFLLFPSMVRALYYRIRLLFSTVTVDVALTLHFKDMFTFILWNTFGYKVFKLPILANHSARTVYKVVWPFGNFQTR